MVMSKQKGNRVEREYSKNTDVKLEELGDLMEGH